MKYESSIITNKDAIDAIERIFNFCEEIDNNIPEEERTGYSMLEDYFIVKDYLYNCKLEKEQIIKALEEHVIEFELFGQCNNYVELSHAIEIVKAGGKE